MAVINKSVAAMIFEDGIECSPSISSPLRRKSMLPQSRAISTLSENDDEAERMARRKELAVCITPLLTQSNDRRRSSLSFSTAMSVQQMKDKISECIKLSVENKINTQNAFSLEVIDFMNYMIKKKEASMYNLQLAATSLDVSTKIYAFRVDGVHTEILKLTSGLEKQNSQNQNEIDDKSELSDASDESQRKFGKERIQKNRKRKRKEVLGSIDSLKGKAQTAKPSIMFMGDSDSLTTDSLNQVMLPIHATSGFCLPPSHDIIVDTVMEEQRRAHETQSCVLPAIVDFFDKEICPALYIFDFEDHTSDMDSDSNNSKKHDTSLELNSSTDSTFDNTQEPEHLGSNRFDIAEADEIEIHHVDRYANAHDANDVENVIDFRDVLHNTKVAKVASEYSFVKHVVDIHWAGPSHWKLRMEKPQNSASRVVETCRQIAAKKKKAVLLCYNENARTEVVGNFLSSRATKYSAKTVNTDWSEDKWTLPGMDARYDAGQFFKGYLHGSMDEAYQTDNRNGASDMCDSVEDYHADDDVLLHGSDDDHGNALVNDKPNAIRTNEQFQSLIASQMPLAGENLIAMPKLTNKVSIAYSIRPKKMDMQQLKNAIWKLLSDKWTAEKIQSTADVQNITIDGSISELNNSTGFGNVYKDLPNMLTKTNANALSFPLAFVSLLHIANERGLCVKSTLDKSDLAVEVG